MADGRLCAQAEGGAAGGRVAIGLGYGWTPDLQFDAAYVHIFLRNASIGEMSQTGDLLVGCYSDHIDLVSVSATLRS
jgi:long-subunit fatty acid transport protein